MRKLEAYNCQNLRRKGRFCKNFAKSGGGRERVKEIGNSIKKSMKDLPNHEEHNEWTYLQWRRKNLKIKIVIQFRDRSCYSSTIPESYSHPNFVKFLLAVYGGSHVGRLPYNLYSLRKTIGVSSILVTLTSRSYSRFERANTSFYENKLGGFELNSSSLEDSVRKNGQKILWFSADCIGKSPNF